MSLPSLTKDLRRIIEKYRPALEPYERLYKEVHQEPELSCKEASTAATVASRLRALEYKVHEGIGGYGVVGVLENGRGSVIMLRSELDALPIREETGVLYASTRYMTDQYGIERPVMHACGHDMHLTCLLAASELLHSSRSCWSGTLIVVFQPNEEHTGGAQAMLSDGLYDKVRVPDIVLGQHSMPIRAGTVNIRSGPILSAADTVKIRIDSSSERSVNPQNGINPIDVATAIVVKLRSLLHVTVPNGEYAVIKCEEIHAGQIGLDTVQVAETTLDVKSYKPEVREELHLAIKRVVEAESRYADLEKNPEIDIKVRAPLTSNSPEVVEPLRKSFDAYFGDNAGEAEPCRSCEDFSYLATSQEKPYAYWFLGTVDTEKWDKACKEGNVSETIPGNHSPFYAPTVQPTLQTGVDAMAVAALTFLA